MATLSPSPLGPSLVAKTLNARNNFDMVHDTSGGYNVLTYLANVMTPGGSKQVNVRKYEKSKRGKLHVIAEVASTAISGSNLVITFTNPTYDNFRLEDKVQDVNEKQGVVVATSPGTITLNPLYGQSWSTATDFVAGTYARATSALSPERGSTGRSSLYNTPDLDYNYSMIARDSCEIMRADMIDTYVKFKGKPWYFNQEFEMIRRMSMFKEHDNIFSERAVQTINGRVTYTNGGLIWAIKNRGGLYYPSAVPVNKSILDDLLYQLSIQRTTEQQRYIMLVGKAAWLQLTRALDDYIKFAGTRNTFKVTEGKGLTVEMYSILGVMVELIQLPAFNDADFFPELSVAPGANGTTRKSNGFFLIDASPRPMVDGGTAPAIEHFHFISPFYYGHITGMPNAAMEITTPEQLQAASATEITTDVDGMSAHAMIDGGIDIIDAKGMAYFELTQ